MPSFNADGKNKKLILIVSGILSVAVLFFVLKILFFSSSPKTAGLASVQTLDIANAESFKVNSLNADFFSSQKFKDFQEYQIKVTDVKDVKKGNANPFADIKAENENIAIDNTAADKLFKEFTQSFGVVLNEAEKTKCLDGIIKQKLASDKYRGHINACFTEKRNKILM
jgi:hypothetical protein